MTTLDDLKNQIAEARKNSGDGIRTITAESGNVYEVRALSPWMGLKLGMRLGAANIKTIDPKQPIDTKQKVEDILTDTILDDYITKVLACGMVNPKFANDFEVREFMELLPADALTIYNAISTAGQQGGDINLSEFPS
ncbi:MAG: hypothetical protein WC623_24420 [Pedobacter sp.]|uniref:hypothetical protein n=1 Tax=Pedobacter sp. TaxID=1411316 RepID=UPI00356AA385